MMLHQDGSRHEWLEGRPPLDLIVTLDDATGAIYSAFLIEEERLRPGGAQRGVRRAWASDEPLHGSRGAPVPVAYSTGIVILLRSAVTPFTYTTGTDTGFISADYLLMHPDA